MDGRAERADRVEHPPLLVEHALLDGLLDPVIAIDDRGTIQLANRSVSSVFGWDPRELIGRNINMLMPEPHHSLHDGYLENYRRTGETFILNRLREFEILRSDGSLAQVELSVARVDLSDDRQPLFIGSFRDIGERKRLQRAETSMLRALAALGRSTAVLAHEIKNPITSVNLALRAVADQLGEDHEAVLNELVARMQRLEVQLRRSLSFAKPLELHVTTCRVADLLADVQTSLDPLLERDGVQLGFEVTPPTLEVDGDPLRLEEVLTNLVRNASEAFEHGGRVHISAAREVDGVTLHVHDDGPGIPRSMRDTLFDPFVTSRADGTGLGLAICRRVIEDHGGTLALAPDAELGGASFRLTLPERRAPTRSSRA